MGYLVGVIDPRVGRTSEPIDGDLTGLFIHPCPYHVKYISEIYDIKYIDIIHDVKYVEEVIDLTYKCKT